MVELLAAAAEDEPVTPLETHHHLAVECPGDQQRIDIPLFGAPPTGDLRHVDDVGMRGKPFQRTDGGEPIGDDGIGGDDGVPAGDGEQAGIAGAASDQDHPAHARPPGALSGRSVVDDAEHRKLACRLGDPPIVVVVIGGGENHCRRIDIAGLNAPVQDGGQAPLGEVAQIRRGVRADHRDQRARLDQFGHGDGRARGGSDDRHPVSA
ncbi:hypothetical protein BN1047_04376 [Mycolicibacterium neoaurum]|uniref:Uncharacterized protein n=1 Tax=Mycolicibacterium neoaurum TaxID=1795 RepID=A0AAV2WQQ5_MYCNE|nr:hypothetical protein BN1047_04376 [Mycolicibacterium neoaurum]